MFALKGVLFVPLYSTCDNFGLIINRKNSKLRISQLSPCVDLCVCACVRACVRACVCDCVCLAPSRNILMDTPVSIGISSLLTT